MKISLICVGKLKENFFREGCEEYLKRLQSYAKVEVIELPDEAAPNNPSQKQIEAIQNKEGERILAKLPSFAYVVAFDGRGKTMDSPSFASFIEKGLTLGGSHLVFIIGGSFGLNDEVRNKANHLLSFGPMTYPHNLARLIALEQIYRGFKILKNEPYHK